MKTRNILFMLLSILLMNLSSCKNFLDVPYQSGSEASTYYNTLYKLQEALNAVYNVLQSDAYNESEWIFGEACGDDVTSAGEGGTGERAELVNFKFSTNNSYIRNRYEINYKGIHYANQVIANANRVEFTQYNYASYKALRVIVGQAKVLRALFYFNLVKTYGGVPIRPEVEDVNNLVVPRSTASQVYAYIEKDLREACVMLDIRYDNEDLGKISRGAALALLMKIQMYQARPGDGSDYWKEVVNLGEYFIDGKSMTMAEMLKYDPAKEDWETLRQRLCFQPKEIKSATDPYEQPTDLLTDMVNAYSLEYRSRDNAKMEYYEQWWKVGEHCKGSIFEVNFAESADGTLGDLNEGGYVFDALFNGEAVASSDFLTMIIGDPRRNYIVRGHWEKMPDGIPCPIPAGSYACMKWYTTPKETPMYGGDNGKNRRYIRYAEVVLTYAEALNECGYGERALTQLNSNKSQANTITGSTDIYPASGYSTMRDNIWSERRRELAFEWDRFFDLVRQGRAATVLHQFSRTYVYARGRYFRDGINDIFPIPQDEIDISNGVVTQNPGY